jgi:hypothetical protein
MVNERYTLKKKTRKLNQKQINLIEKVAKYSYEI